MSKQQENLNKFGLKVLTPDERDFKMGAFFRVKKDLPEKFYIKPPKVKDQQDSDYCSQFTLSSMAEMMDKVELSPLWAFAVAKLVEGDPTTWGLEMRDAFKVWTKYGGVPEKDAEFKIKDPITPQVRNYANWIKPYPMRFDYGKGSFWSVLGWGKPFDNIKQALEKFDQPVALGVIWGWNPREYKLKKSNWKDGKFGHMVFAYGWDGNYLKIQNSWGRGVGKKGRHLLHKDMVNKYAPMFGAMTWTDLPADKAQYYLENEIKESDNWVVQMLKIILSNIKAVASKM